MTEDLQAYLQDPGPPEDGSYTNLQRRALGEVLKLSTEIVHPLESEIEREFQARRSQIQQEFDSGREKIESRRKSRSAKLREQRDVGIEKVNAQYDERVRSIEADARQKLAEVERGAAQLQQKAQKQWQDQELAVDFVGEGAAERAKKKRLDAKNAVAQANRHIDDLAARANELLRLYRQNVPEDKGGQTSGVADADGADYRSRITIAQENLEKLGSLRSARLFVGATPVLLAIGLLLAVLVVVSIPYVLDVDGLPSVVAAGLFAAVVTCTVIGVVGYALWKRASRCAQEIYDSFQSALKAARTALAEQHSRALEQIEQEYRSSAGQKEAELRQANEALDNAKIAIAKRKGAMVREIEADRQKMMREAAERKDDSVRQIEQDFERQNSELQEQSEKALRQLQQEYERQTQACEKQYIAKRRPLEQRWDKGLAYIQSLLERVRDVGASKTADWKALAAEPPASGQAGGSMVPFGTIRLDTDLLSDSVLDRAEPSLREAETVSIPAVLEFPDRCSMLLQYEREGRQQAIEALRAVMLRLFISLPPGRAHFTFIDPVGLGESFAGFMHAADYLQSLVGGRIWTETAQIQQQLEGITQHMENVIQKYLRNEFETIEQYNEQAGELAEPYHFVVIADFPVNFNEEAARRLSSIVHSGARCGVHTLIAWDTRSELPTGVDIKDVSTGSIHLVYRGGAYVWQDETMKRFGLQLDRPPAESVLTEIMHRIGKAGTESARVEIAFDAVAPEDGQLWSLSSRRDLRVPLGRTGATQLQYLELGRGVAQHMLIAGKTGSGKSTLLHVMVTNLALWYSPDEIEVYLIDFKQGVEFKTYVTHDLPHARAVAIESDREFGLSILQRLEGEMVRRGELFRQAGVQDIASYRETTGEPMPRTLLIVDEFQMFFSEDDKLAQDAAILLEQLVRQGRAFGIHVVLGSQTLGGVFGLARSTIGQMAVRIALQCSEADSQLILDDDNIAARSLSRPGEAIYNDVGGRVVGNSPFQVAWLPDAARDSRLERISSLADQKRIRRERIIVFEGSAAADIRDNQQLAACLDGKAPKEMLTAPRIWLGAPVTIKHHTAAVLHRQSGSNVLIVGQRDEVAMNLMIAAMVGLAAQLDAGSTQFVVMDGSAPDSPQAGVLERIGSRLPQDCRIVGWSDVAETLAELNDQATRRAEADQRNQSAVVLFVYGLQRYRMLRRSEDAFGLSLDEDAEQTADAQFASLLREGPGVGIHVMAWADTLSTVERSVDRQTMREFDYRVLFQMSATDSSNLADSPLANRLGYHRALLYSEAQGTLEKFRPYAALDEQWLDGIAQKLR